MKPEHYMSRVAGATYDKRAWMLAFFFALIAVMSLSAALIFKKNSVQTIFLIPEINKAFTLSDGRYSPAYVEQVTTWFLSQTLNYHPSSYKYQMDTFLKHIDPALFGSLRQTLLQEFEDIQKQNRSSIFFIQDVVIKGLSAMITGVHEVRIGATEASSEQEHWYLRLTQRSDGLVTLADIKKVGPKEHKEFVNQ